MFFKLLVKLILLQKVSVCTYCIAFGVHFGQTLAVDKTQAQATPWLLELVPKFLWITSKKIIRTLICHQRM